MIGAAYAENRDGLVELRSFEQGGAVADGRAVRAVMLSRLDTDVRVLELPAIAEGEVAGFLRYRIPALYPGRPEETAFDYRVIRRGRRRWAMLFLVKHAVLHACREAAPGARLFAPFSLLEPGLSRSDRRSTLVVFWHETWAELLSLPAHDAPRSVVVRRTGDPDADRERLREAVPGGFPADAAWILWCSRSEADALAQWARGCAGPQGEVAVRTMDEALRHLGRGRSFLFDRPGGRPRLPAPGVRLQVYVGLALLIGVLILHRSVEHDEGRLRELEGAVKAMQGRTATVVALGREAAAAREELVSLRGRRPVNTYLLLAEVQSILTPESVVSLFELEEGAFRIEATGRDPLELMEAFQDRELFDDVKLVQIVPERGSGRERYTLTGAVHAE